MRRVREDERPYSHMYALHSGRPMRCHRALKLVLIIAAEREDDLTPGRMRRRRIRNVAQPLSTILVALTRRRASAAVVEQPLIAWACGSAARMHHLEKIKPRVATPRLLRLNGANKADALSLVIIRAATHTAVLTPPATAARARRCVCSPRQCRSHCRG